MDINRTDLIDQLVEKHNYTKKAAKSVVDDFTDIVIDNMLRGNTVSIYGFGCFDILHRAEHRVANPRTGEPVCNPAHYIPRFYPGDRMRRAVKKWEVDNERGLS